MSEDGGRPSKFGWEICRMACAELSAARLQSHCRGSSATYDHLRSFRMFQRDSSGVSSLQCLVKE